jgi:hypothetical protein
MPAAETAPPTVAQLLNLADRAEHKGGLTYAEASRLRNGILSLADDEAARADLHRRYRNATDTANRWKKRALSNGIDESEAALRRVTALAQRWMHIPAKRRAATSIITTLTNRDPDD